jgi:RNA polymerase sigma factor (sigma-70 family)
MILKQDIFLKHPNKLIQGCIDGDRHSQTQLYELFASTMFVVCLRYSANREEAEEILQEGFLKVFEFIHQFRFEGSFEGWMRKIMVNCALQKYRNKQQLYALVNIEVTNFDHLYNDEIITQLSTKELLGMVQALPPACRMVFNLYVFEGMKHREIAEYLGVSEGTSKSNLFDARRILQRIVNNSFKIVNQSY